MLDFALSVAQNAGEYIRKHIKADLIVEHKGRTDLVTSVDKGAQRLIINAIEEHFPQHGILAEEGVKKCGRDHYTWIVDPLDGTTNFVHGLPVFCVSIALYREGEPHLGVCYNPVSAELFSAESGKGAFLNGQQLTVSKTDKLMNALVATGFPYRTNDMQGIMARFFRIVSQAQGVRRLGSAAIDLCYVACGNFDAFWEAGLQPWDMAAGALILQEAGGQVSNLDGTALDLAHGEIVASNAILHDALLMLM